MVEMFRSELTIRSDDLEADILIVAEVSQGIAGIVQVSVEGREATLEKLFIEPVRMGAGVGRLLYDWACEAARRRGASRLIIEADPDAAAFYARMGASPRGREPVRLHPGQDASAARARPPEQAGRIGPALRCADSAFDAAHAPY